MFNGTVYYYREIGEDMGHAREHYNSGKLECIEVIEAFDLSRNLANVVKYVLRADRKGQRNSDLEKAINYLWRELYGCWAPLPEADDELSEDVPADDL